MTTIVEDTKLDFSDVLLMPKRSTLSSRSEVDVRRTFKFKHARLEYIGVPIIAANMDTIGTFEMAKALSQFDMACALHKFYTADQLISYFKSPDRNRHTFYSMGITDVDLEKYLKVNDDLKAHSPQAAIKYICIDVANGYSRKFVNFVERMRNEANDAVIMAGNVVTPDMVYDLLERGADIVKVGIGPGSVCTTRRITGVGYPQLSAVLECQDAAHGADGLICSDGGIIVPGDVAKAFGAGADFIMCGGILSGHYECSGQLANIKLNPKVQTTVGMYVDPIGGADYVHTITYQLGDQTIKVLDRDYRNDIEQFDFRELPPAFYESGTMRYYGMSSHEAMDKHYGGKANYRASEGKVVEVPYKGSVVNTCEEILGGLRSACTYVGARRLKDLPKCSTFVKVNRQLNNSLSQYDANT